MDAAMANDSTLAFAVFLLAPLALMRRCRRRGSARPVAVRAGSPQLASRTARRSPDQTRRRATA